MSKKSNQLQKDAQLIDPATTLARNDSKSKSSLTQITLSKKKKSTLPSVTMRPEEHTAEDVPKPVVRVKAVPEIKKLEEQISKAPVACQSLLKVVWF